MEYVNNIVCCLSASKWRGFWFLEGVDDSTEDHRFLTIIEQVIAGWPYWAILGSVTLGCCFSGFLFVLHLSLYKLWEGPMSLVHDKFCIFGNDLRIFCNWILSEISCFYISWFFEFPIASSWAIKELLISHQKTQYPFNSVLYDQKTHYM